MDLLTEPLREGITQRAILELLILAVVCGPLGVWVVLYRQSYATESIAHSMLPGLVIASLASIPLGFGATSGLAVAAICIAAASRQRAVGADVAVAVTVTGLFGLGTLLALSPDVPVRLGEILFGGATRTVLASATRVVRARRLVEVEDLETLAAWADLHSGPSVGKWDATLALGGQGTPKVRDHCLGEIAIARGTGVSPPATRSPTCSTCATGSRSPGPSYAAARPR